jgi:transglutaminase-like putative cysteine protease
LISFFIIRFSLGFRISIFRLLRTPMSLKHWYRLLEYLTLGLSCTALVLAEAPFLPDLQLCLAPVLALLLLGWSVEGRWSLPNRGADLLGLLIVGAGAIWMWTHRAEKDFTLAQLPLLVAMLPYMGPLLMAALLVKVFRRHDPDHFWHVQGMGLTQVGLGCMLEGGPAFGVAMAAYLACYLACLALHYRLSAIRHPPSAQDRKGERRADGGWWLLSFTPRWTLLIAVPALLLFLLTPRHDNWAWEPLNSIRSGSNRIHVGGSGEMNLNNTGRLELDDEIALQVSAVDAAGRPKLDLPVDQRWRSVVLDRYDHGMWTMQEPVPENSSLVQQHELPNFGPNQYFLNFAVTPRRAGGLVLAEPIRLGLPLTRLPVLPLDDAGPRRLFTEHASALLPVEVNDKRREYHYRQVVPALRDPSRTPADGLHFIRNLSHLIQLPDELRPALQSWTTDLFRRLSKEPRYQLPRSVRAALAHDSTMLAINQIDHEATARLLTDYLAHSGEYSYSLEITRQDRSKDPVLDFLLNIKKGHCERYAAALTSILRSMGIAARIVKGFRGWSSKGDGEYVVRHHHAHAWVEAMVPRNQFSTPRLFPPIRAVPSEWITLDPTPPATIEEASRPSAANLWEEAQQYCLQGWRSLIVDYDGDEQADLLEAMTSGQRPSGLLKLGFAVLALGTAIAAWLLLRRLRYHRRTVSIHGNGPDTALYPRLIRILGRYASLRPHLGQTPHEYGEAARACLNARPTLTVLAGWPMRVIDLFYRARFGGRPLREDERQTLDREFEHFSEAMRQSQA